MKTENKCFKKITNNDIYNLLIEQGKEIQRNKTRSIVNAWLGSTALSVSIGVLIAGVLI
jgi:ribosomal protein L9